MLRFAAVLFFLAPAGAWAAANGPTIVSQDLPIGVSRTTAGSAAPKRFDLVGLHWQGTGSVVFRTRSIAGRWTSWRRAAPEDEDQPDRASRELGARRAWRLGNPYWVGASDRLQWRIRGKVTRVRAWYVGSPTGRSTLRTVSMAGSPKIVTRSAWRADDEILRGKPRYAGRVYFAIVHHTAGSNAYTAAQSPAIVRAIQLYHVRGNGWNDIGYNFLVDKYGQVFEGRIGGIERNVVGAHAQGFNHGSTGVAMLGSYGSAPITLAARRALVQLLAWRLDVAHVDPLSLVNWSSGGNPKYPLGAHVKLRAISGHRDTGFTSCPGTRLYARLPDIVHAVAATGLPKLYSPTVSGGLGGSVRFSARLSAAGAWAVTVRDASGAVVARGRGSGSSVAWTWDATGIPSTRSYTWTIEAGPQTRPASGTIGKAPLQPAPPPALSLLSALTVTPTAISPDGDGIDDGLTVSYVLAARASVTATVKDATGGTIATLFASQAQSARRQVFPYAATGLADGTYAVTVVAVGADGRSASLEAPFAIDRTLSAPALTTSLLTPNGDGVDDTLGISFTLATDAQVTVQIEQAGTVVAAVFGGLLPAGPSQIVWDGTTPAGPAPPGTYEAVVLVNGLFGATRRALTFALQ
jgi:N-acetylmuramoyl-L-alanine amidase/FlgD Ig-like domain